MPSGVEHEEIADGNVVMPEPDRRLDAFGR